MTFICGTEHLMNQKMHLVCGKKPQPHEKCWCFFKSNLGCKIKKNPIKYLGSLCSSQNYRT